MTVKPSKPSSFISRLGSWLKKLGPGLITGAADDDPSGIATYSQSGAQFGFNVLWTVLVTTPLMVAIQLVSARLSLATGRGIAANMRHRFNAPLTYTLVSLLIIANVINIAADISAMSAAVHLLVGGSTVLYALIIGMGSLYAQIRIPFAPYARILKWLTLSLFVYVGIVFAVDIPWREVLARTVLPSMTMNSNYWTTIVAILGTTISPYLFFWQAAQEVTEHARSRRTSADSKMSVPRELKRIKIDTLSGMLLSNAIAFFIILTTAVTLHTHGVTDVQTTEQAAQALRPIAGEFASLLFSLGIVGTGLLSVPVLAGSSAYAWAGARDIPCGLDKKFSQAREFYAIVAVTTLIGVALTFVSLDPIKMLYWAAVVNGVIAVPIMIAMLLMARSRTLMHRFKLGTGLTVLAWCAALVMTTAVAVMFVDLFG